MVGGDVGCEGGGVGAWGEVGMQSVQVIPPSCL